MTSGREPIGVWSAPAFPTVMRTVAARFERLDSRFDDVRGDVRWEHHFDGGRWTEGPLYVPAAGYVIFSDIPDDRVLRWDEHTGLVSQLPGSSNYANGRTLDRCGRVVTCEQGARRVVRTEHDGSTSVLADAIGGARFNSPNDVVVSGDGSVWFTDPSYGIDSDYEGFRAASELDGCHVYRIADGEVRAVATDFERPNGLAFSTDERWLYVVDSARDHIRRFVVADDATLGDGRVIAESTAGHFDGIRVDASGRLWAAAEDGVHCFDHDGTLLGKIHLPEPVSNLTFGGRKRNRLFVTATSSLYSIVLAIAGARPSRRAAADGTLR